MNESVKSEPDREWAEYWWEFLEKFDDESLEQIAHLWAGTPHFVLIQRMIDDVKKRRLRAMQRAKIRGAINAVVTENYGRWLTEIARGA